MKDKLKKFLFFMILILSATLFGATTSNSDGNSENGNGEGSGVVNEIITDNPDRKVTTVESQKTREHATLSLTINKKNSEPLIGRRVGDMMMAYLPIKVPKGGNIKAYAQSTKPVPEPRIISKVQLPPEMRGKHPSKEIPVYVKEVLENEKDKQLVTVTETTEGDKVFIQIFDKNNKLIKGYAIEDIASLWLPTLELCYSPSKGGAKIETLSNRIIQKTIEIKSGDTLADNIILEEKNGDFPIDVWGYKDDQPWSKVGMIDFYTYVKNSNGEFNLEKLNQEGLYTLEPVQLKGYGSADNIKYKPREDSKLQILLNNSFSFAAKVKAPKMPNEDAGFDNISFSKVEYHGQVDDGNETYINKVHETLKTFDTEYVLYPEDNSGVKYWNNLKVGELYRDDITNIDYCDSSLVELYGSLRAQITKLDIAATRISLRRNGLNSLMGKYEFPVVLQGKTKKSEDGSIVDRFTINTKYYIDVIDKNVDKNNLGDWKKHKDPKTIFVPKPSDTTRNPFLVIGESAGFTGMGRFENEFSDPDGSGPGLYLIYPTNHSESSPVSKAIERIPVYKDTIPNNGYVRKIFQIHTTSCASDFNLPTGSQRKENPFIPKKDIQVWALQSDDGNARLYMQKSKGEHELTPVILKSLTLVQASDDPGLNLDKPGVIIYKRKDFDVYLAGGETKEEFTSKGEITIKMDPRLAQNLKTNEPLSGNRDEEMAWISLKNGDLIDNSLTESGAKINSNVIMNKENTWDLYSYTNSINNFTFTHKNDGLIENISIRGGGSEYPRLYDITNNGKELGGIYGQLNGYVPTIKGGYGYAPNNVWDNIGVAIRHRVISGATDDVKAEPSLNYDVIRYIRTQDKDSGDKITVKIENADHTVPVSGYKGKGVLDIAEIKLNKPETFGLNKIENITNQNEEYLINNAKKDKIIYSGEFIKGNSLIKTTSNLITHFSIGNSQKVKSDQFSSIYFEKGNVEIKVTSKNEIVLKVSSDVDLGDIMKKIQISYFKQLSNDKYMKLGKFELLLVDSSKRKDMGIATFEIDKRLQQNTYDNWIRANGSISNELANIGNESTNKKKKLFINYIAPSKKNDAVKFKIVSVNEREHNQKVGNYERYLLKNNSSGNIWRDEAAIPVYQTGIQINNFWDTYPVVSKINESDINPLSTKFVLKSTNGDGMYYTGEIKEKYVGDNTVSIVNAEIEAKKIEENKKYIFRADGHGNGDLILSDPKIIFKSLSMIDSNLGVVNSLEVVIEKGNESIIKQLNRDELSKGAILIGENGKTLNIGVDGITTDSLGKDLWIQNKGYVFEDDINFIIRYKYDPKYEIESLKIGTKPIQIGVINLTITSNKKEVTNTIKIDGRIENKYPNFLNSWITPKYILKENNGSEGKLLNSALISFTGTAKNEIGGTENLNIYEKNYEKPLYFPKNGSPIFGGQQYDFTEYSIHVKDKNVGEVKKFEEIISYKVAKTAETVPGEEYRIQLKNTDGTFFVAQLSDKMEVVGGKEPDSGSGTISNLKEIPKGWGLGRTRARIYLDGSMKKQMYDKNDTVVDKINSEGNGLVVKSRVFTWGKDPLRDKINELDILVEALETNSKWRVENNTLIVKTQDSKDVKFKFSLLKNRNGEAVLEINSQDTPDYLSDFDYGDLEKEALRVKVTISTKDGIKLSETKLKLYLDNIKLIGEKSFTIDKRLGKLTNKWVFGNGNTETENKYPKLIKEIGELSNEQVAITSVQKIGTDKELTSKIINGTTYKYSTSENIGIPEGVKISDLNQNKIAKILNNQLVDKEVDFEINVDEIIYVGSIKEKYVGSGDLIGTGKMSLTNIDIGESYYFTPGKSGDIVGKLVGGRESKEVILKVPENNQSLDARALTEFDPTQGNLANKIKVSVGAQEQLIANKRRSITTAVEPQTVNVGNIAGSIGLGISSEGGLIVKKVKDTQITNPEPIIIEYYYDPVSTPGSISTSAVKLGTFTLNVTNNFKENSTIDDITFEVDSRLIKDWYRGDGHSINKNPSNEKVDYSKMIEITTITPLFQNNDNPIDAVDSTGATVGEDKTLDGIVYKTFTNESKNIAIPYKKVKGSTSLLMKEFPTYMLVHGSAEPITEYNYTLYSNNTKYDGTIEKNTVTFDKHTSTGTLDITNAQINGERIWKSEAISDTQETDGMKLTLDSSGKLFKMESLGETSVVDSFKIEVLNTNEVTEDKEKIITGETLSTQLKFGDGSIVTGGGDVQISFTKENSTNPGEFKVKKLTSATGSIQVKITPMYKDVVLGELTLTIENKMSPLEDINFTVDKRIAQVTAGDWLHGDGTLKGGTSTNDITTVGDYAPFVTVTFGSVTEATSRNNADIKVTGVDKINDAEPHQAEITSGNITYAYSGSQNNKIALPYDSDKTHVTLADYQSDLENSPLVISKEDIDESTSRYARSTYSNTFVITGENDGSTVKYGGTIKETYTGEGAYTGAGTLDLSTGVINTLYTYNPGIKASNSDGTPALSVTSGRSIDGRPILDGKTETNIINKIIVGKSDATNNGFEGKTQTLTTADISQGITGVALSEIGLGTIKLGIGTNGGMTIEKTAENKIESTNIRIEYYYTPNVTGDDTNKRIKLGDFTLTLTNDISSNITDKGSFTFEVDPRTLQLKNASTPVTDTTDLWVEQTKITKTPFGTSENIDGNMLVTTNSIASQTFTKIAYVDTPDTVETDSTGYNLYSKNGENIAAISDTLINGIDKNTTQLYNNVSLNNVDYTDIFEVSGAKTKSIPIVVLDNSNYYKVTGNIKYVVKNGNSIEVPATGYIGTGSITMTGTTIGATFEYSKDDLGNVNSGTKPQLTLGENGIFPDTLGVVTGKTTTNIGDKYKVTHVTETVSPNTQVDIVEKTGASSDIGTGVTVGGKYKITLYVDKTDITPTPKLVVEKLSDATTTLSDIKIEYYDGNIKLGEFTLSITNVQSSTGLTPISFKIDKRLADITDNWVFTDGTIKSQDGTVVGSVGAYSNFVSATVATLRDVVPENVVIKDILKIGNTEGDAQTPIEASGKDYKYRTIDGDTVALPYGDNIKLSHYQLNNSDTNHPITVFKGDLSTATKKVSKYFQISGQEGSTEAKQYNGTLEKEYMGDGKAIGSGSLDISNMVVGETYKFAPNTATSVTGEKVNASTETKTSTVTLMLSDSSKSPNPLKVVGVTTEKENIANYISLSRGTSDQNKQESFTTGELPLSTEMVEYSNLGVKIGFDAEGYLLVQKTANLDIKNEPTTNKPLTITYAYKPSQDSAESTQVTLGTFDLTITNSITTNDLGTADFKVDDRLINHITKSNEVEEKWYIANGNVLAESETSTTPLYSNFIDMTDFSDGNSIALLTSNVDTIKKVTIDGQATTDITLNSQRYKGDTELAIPLVEYSSFKDITAITTDGITSANEKTKTFTIETDRQNYSGNIKQMKVANYHDSTATLELSGIAKDTAGKWTSESTGTESETSTNMTLTFSNSGKLFNMDSITGEEAVVTHYKVALSGAEGTADYKAINDVNGVSLNLNSDTVNDGEFKINGTSDVNRTPTNDIKVRIIKDTDNKGRLEITKLTHEIIDSKTIVVIPYREISSGNYMELGKLTLTISNTAENLGTATYSIDKRIISGYKGFVSNGDTSLSKYNWLFLDKTGATDLINTNVTKDAKIDFAPFIDISNNLTILKNENTYTGISLEKRNFLEYQEATTEYHKVQKSKNEFADEGAFPKSGKFSELSDKLVISKFDITTPMENAFVLVGNDNKLYRGVLTESYIEPTKIKGSGTLEGLEEEVTYTFPPGATGSVTGTPATSGKSNVTLNVTEGGHSPSGLGAVKEQTDVVIANHIKVTKDNSSSTETNLTTSATLNGVTFGIVTTETNKGGLSIQLDNTTGDKSGTYKIEFFKWYKNEKVSARDYKVKLFEFDLTLETKKPLGTTTFNIDKRMAQLANKNEWLAADGSLYNETGTELGTYSDLVNVIFTKSTDALTGIDGHSVIRVEKINGKTGNEITTSTVANFNYTYPNGQSTSNQKIAFPSKNGDINNVTIEDYKGGNTTKSSKLIVSTKDIYEAQTKNKKDEASNTYVIVGNDGSKDTKYEGVLTEVYRDSTTPMEKGIWGYSGTGTLDISNLSIGTRYNYAAGATSTANPIGVSNEEGKITINSGRLVDGNSILNSGNSNIANYIVFTAGEKEQVIKNMVRTTDNELTPQEVTLGDNNEIDGKLKIGISSTGGLIIEKVDEGKFTDKAVKIDYYYNPTDSNQETNKMILLGTFTLTLTNGVEDIGDIKTEVDPRILQLKDKSNSELWIRTSSDAEVTAEAFASNSTDEYKDLISTTISTTKTISYSDINYVGKGVVSPEQKGVMNIYKKEDTNIIGIHTDTDSSKNLQYHVIHPIEEITSSINTPIIMTGHEINRFGKNTGKRYKVGMLLEVMDKTDIPVNGYRGVGELRLEEAPVKTLYTFAPKGMVGNSNGKPNLNITIPTGNSIPMIPLNNTMLDASKKVGKRKSGNIANKIEVKVSEDGHTWKKMETNVSVNTDGTTSTITQTNNGHQAGDGKIKIGISENGGLTLTKETNGDFDKWVKIVYSYKTQTKGKTIKLGEVTLHIINEVVDLGTINYEVDGRYYKEAQAQNKNLWLYPGEEGATTKNINDKGDQNIIKYGEDTIFHVDNSGYKNDGLAGEIEDIIGIDGRTHKDARYTSKVNKIKYGTYLVADQKWEDESAVPISKNGETPLSINELKDKLIVSIFNKKDSPNLDNRFYLLAKNGDNHKRIYVGNIKENIVGSTEILSGGGKIDITNLDRNSVHVFPMIYPLTGVAISDNGLAMTDITGMMVDGRGRVGENAGKLLANKIKITNLKINGHSETDKTEVEGLTATIDDSIIVGLYQKREATLLDGQLEKPEGGLVLARAGEKRVPKIEFKLEYYYEPNKESQDITTNAVKLGEFNLIVEDSMFEIDGNNILDFGNMSPSLQLKYTAVQVFDVKNPTNKKVKFTPKSRESHMMLISGNSQDKKSRIEITDIEIPENWQNDYTFMLRATANIDKDQALGNYQGIIDIVVTIEDE